MRIIFGVLFIVFLSITVRYAEKDLIIYQSETIEDVKTPPGGSVRQEVTRVYHENYAAIGGAIGFSILAAASLVAFVFIQLEKSKQKDPPFSSNLGKDQHSSKGT